VVLASTDLSDSRRTAVPGRATLSVATFNLHAGVDGWGRPFDVVGACRAIDADVLVLEETWTPESETGTAATVGRALGYAVFEQPLAGGRLAGPHPQADGRWMKSFDWRGSSHAIYLDSERPLSRKIGRSRRYLDAEPGHWGVAVLSRLPVRGRRVVDLGLLKQDRARRFALVVEIEVGGMPLTVVGTHMSHLSYGAPIQFLRLSRAIRQLVPSGPGILAGDMNLWGPPVAAFFPGWRRALLRKTWPAWRPHSQVDHILIRSPLAVEGGEAYTSMGSDHLPLRVRLTTAG
jgi:endonuclease/exonuclease/phosphatase family metal-dependent hydrolase